MTSIALMLAAAISNAQTTATDWTATDCDGLSHTLFNELDSSKVIVFVWVMPCGACVAPSKTAYDAVQTFASTHPGKVRYYLADDLGDASCATLSSWVTSNSVGSTANMKIFSNAGNVIDEAGFGGPGMPHVVVMGGTSHTIFFNKKAGAANDPTGITNAITAAIGATTAVSSVSGKAAFSVIPNPVANVLSISCERPIKKVVITAADGRVMLAREYKGVIDPSVDMSQYAAGIYLVTITDTDNKTATQKVTKQ